MQLLVKKWGNSAAIRLPASIMAEVRLELDQAVVVRAEGGQIVIVPVRAPEYDLATLIAAITPENLHAETDWGNSEGAELL
jgi:antitoxin MazE